MTNFKRGDVVFHKIMGISIVLNILNDGMVEVRMKNGNIEKFYPEELVSKEEHEKPLKEALARQRERAEKWRKSIL